MKEKTLSNKEEPSSLALLTPMCTRAYGVELSRQTLPTSPVPFRSNPPQTRLIENISQQQNTPRSSTKTPRYEFRHPTSASSKKATDQNRKIRGILQLHNQRLLNLTVPTTKSQQVAPSKKFIQLLTQQSKLDMARTGREWKHKPPKTKGQAPSKQQKTCAKTRIR